MGNIETKVCQYCGEVIKLKAIKCRYCYSPLDENAFTNAEKSKVLMLENDQSHHQEIDVDQGNEDINNSTPIIIGSNGIKKESTIDEDIESKRSLFSNVALGSFILSALFILAGFYKMFIYANYDSSEFSGINAYVGGDAYNFIINANYATAYFSLAIVCAVIGMMSIITLHLISIQILLKVNQEGSKELNQIL